MGKINLKNYPQKQKAFQQKKMFSAIGQMVKKCAVKKTKSVSIAQLIEEKYEKINYDEQEVKNQIQDILKTASVEQTVEHMKQIYSLIDLTTLNTSDKDESVQKLCDQINSHLEKYPNIPNVAAICVYPPFVKYAKEHINDKNFNIASVSACFPSSQTFIEVKTLEVTKCVQQGANEIDIVISVGKFLEGKYDLIYEEIKSLKEACMGAKLKVILETGELKNLNLIRMASLIAMEAGANFIKTSTGKVTVSSTPEAIYVMCQAIKEFNGKNNCTIGLKPAGGIRTADEGWQAYKLVFGILGQEYTQNKLFRIGASSLAGNVIKSIELLESQK
eukprot:TRINITY_DN12_c0_g1_i1.p2 TRINITY_DN12_c0_g1~~TRINITY_DN12_c0_g1_i1.p2  ORF type:complete len:332 (-),score=62.27 TRINITY_DN12_c0_g1_i1:72-1067(-)